jgi:hypothetical protein
MEKTQAGEIVAMLAAGYPIWKPTQQTVDLYIKLLEPLPAAATEEAVMQILRSDREFAPPVGVVIQTATRIALAQSGAAVTTAEEAWGQVESAIRKLGHYQGPGEFAGNKAIQRAVAAIGWSNLCFDENVVANRAHFMRIFESYQARELENAVDLLGHGKTLPEVTPPPQIAPPRAWTNELPPAQEVRDRGVELLRRCRESIADESRSDEEEVKPDAR